MSSERALEKAKWYCSFQERSIFDVENRFRAWRVKSEEWDKLIDELIEQDFINEKRFIEAYVRGKFLIKKWGKNKIKSGLYQKKIVGVEVDKVMEQEILFEKYVETIKHLIEKKKEQINTTEKSEITEKLYRYLTSKGFESELIFKCLNHE